MKALPAIWTDTGSKGSRSRKQSVSTIQEEESQSDAASIFDIEQNNGSMQHNAAQNIMDLDPDANDQGLPPIQQQREDHTVMPQTAIPQRHQRHQPDYPDDAVNAFINGLVAQFAENGTNNTAQTTQTQSTARKGAVQTTDNDGNRGDGDDDESDDMMMDNKMIIKETVDVAAAEVNHLANHKASQSQLFRHQQDKQLV